ncbi:MAG: hypothetical protein NXH81_00790 [Halieaceae bacterium]|uniref:hypothetical protein n=1 Tax=Haliea alexandrii TaxID=2448162 RepID=UPI000F0B78CF|nr:hypothetical protein [Haliea alexandrii]MCR9183910.1 hypothetical protein [Halieaceae bacterium]
MRITNKNVFGGLVLGAVSLLLSTQAMAEEEWPMYGADYWDVTAVDVKDGGSWKYTNWLSDEWRKNSEFAKSKGWIKDYVILSNVHARKGEPDLYIIRIIESVPSGAEGEKRQKEYAAWSEKSEQAMVDESGNRAEYREVQGSSLLQVLKFRE